MPRPAELIYHDLVRREQEQREREEAEQRARAESVISIYHPDNNHPHEAPNGTRNYVFRQRQTKLNLTLGWELEANHVPTRVPAGVEHISDGSVDGDGAEFVVMPAITKSPRYVLGLLKELVHAPRLNTNPSCGFHVHVSTSNLSLARMRQWAIATEHLALEVEDLAFKAVPDSRIGNQYCKRIVPLTNGVTFEAHKYNNSRRYHWFNIVEMFRPNGIRTLEVRLLGNTHRWKYLLAWSLFTMELASRGWELAVNPFEIKPHVDVLGQMLKGIAKEIKPLSKKSEPTPSWVYEGFQKFGIEANVWDRPLARIVETEADTRGVSRPFYNDDQIELPNEEHDEDDYCPCGCGNEGRCNIQLHEDGDCDNNYCEYCHENGNCNGLPGCERCLRNAHRDGGDCQRRICRTCRPQDRPVPRAVMPTVTTNSNITINPGPQLTVETTRQGIEVLIAEAMTRDTVLSTFVGWEDISAPIDGLVMERRANEMMTGTESLQSIEYEIQLRNNIAENYMTLNEMSESLERLNERGIF
jgi:hypothetical protein